MKCNILKVAVFPQEKLVRIWIKALSNPGNGIHTNNEFTYNPDMPFIFCIIKLVKPFAGHSIWGIVAGQNREDWSKWDAKMHPVIGGDLDESISYELETEVYEAKQPEQKRRIPFIKLLDLPWLHSETD